CPAYDQGECHQHLVMSRKVTPRLPGSRQQRVEVGKRRVSMPSQPVYLDNHATTRVDPRVAEAMIPYFTDYYGNAASTSHRFGRDASDAVERAREHVARAIGAEARDIIFTSGATESNNLAIKGVAHASLRRGNHLVTAISEHRAVLDPIKRLSR